MTINKLENMQAKILSPGKVIYDAECKLMQFPGKDGLFEVLDNHDHMIATLEKGKIKVETDNGSKQFFEITGGVVEVGKNVVSVLID